MTEYFKVNDKVNDQALRTHADKRYISVIIIIIIIKLKTFTKVTYLPRVFSFQ